VAAAGGTRVLVATKNLRGYRGLSLDGYGSLLQGGPDTMPQVLLRLLADHGKPVDRAANDLWRKGLHAQYAADPFVAFREAHRSVFNELFTRFGIRGDVDACIDEAFDEYRHAKAHPEVHAVLRELEADVALAVVSNMDTMVLLDALHNNGLSFTFIVTSEEEQRYKPSRSIFERAIRYLGLPAENVLHVGDSYLEDVVGPTSAGMGSLLIRRSGASGDPPPKSTPIVSDLRDVREFVRGSWK
jgi:2-haloacid dehalogenase/putative hydrolase of the HAD superfamily